MLNRHHLRRTLSGLLASAVMLCAGLTAAPVPAAAATAAETFCERVHTAWKNGSTSVSLRNISLTLDEATTLYYGMLYTEAEWFYVSSSFSYSTGMNGNLSAFVIKYNCDTKQIAPRKAELEGCIDRLVSDLHADWTDAEKLLYFHDWLSTHCSYDLSYTYGDAYAAMISGSAVCQGYALAMCLLARRIGIECYPIVSDNLKHMWNVVKLGDDWYHLDVTFDDYAPDMIGHAAHEYFLCSDAFMMEDDHHKATDWRTFSDGLAITCDSDAYQNAFWHDAMDSLQPMPDGTWVFARGNDPDSVKYASDVKAVLTRADFDSERSLLTVTDGHWLTDRGSVYTLCYVNSEVWNDRIYYQTPDKIWSVDLNGGDKKTLCTLTAEEKAKGSIYGIQIDETGLLTYQIQRYPSYQDETLTMDVSFGTVQLEAPAEVTTSEPTDTTTTTTTATTTTTTETTTTTTETTTTTTPTETTVTTTTTPAPPETTETVSETSEDTAANVTSDTAVILPERNTDVSSTCLSNDTQPVWDEDGHYRGTNALWSVHLELVTMPEIAFPVELPVDLSSIRVNLIEERRFNIYSHNVSGMLQVVGYGYTDDTQTEFYIDLTTDYKVNDQYEGMLEPLRLTFREQADTTLTDPTETAETTTEPLKPKKAGDVDANGEVNVADAVLLARYCAEDKEITVSPQGRINADCNGDGDVTVEDNSWILQLLAGLL